MVLGYVKAAWLYAPEHSDDSQAHANIIFFNEMKLLYLGVAMLERVG
jgi:hypothetical protein